MIIKNLLTILSSLLISSLTLANGLVGLGSFDSDELIGDPQLRGNISSVYYNGVGSYIVSFDAEQPGTVEDYVAIPTGWKGNEARVCDVDRQSKTVYDFTITCKDSDGNAADPKNVQFAVLRIEPEE